MKKNKTKPKPKYAPIIATSIEARTHGSGETRDAAERQLRRAPDQRAEDKQRAHNMMKDHACCYHECPEPGTIHIGINGNPDTHWICFRHLDRWNRNRARFLADGGGCEMQELGELLEGE